MPPGSDDCNALSQEYGVTTGALQAVTDKDDCTSSVPVCIPLQCTLTLVSGNTTCQAYPRLPGLL